MGLYESTPAFESTPDNDEEVGPVQPEPERPGPAWCFRPHCDRPAMFQVTLPSSTREVPTCSAHVAGVLRSTPVGHTTAVQRVSTR